MTVRDWNAVTPGVDRWASAASLRMAGEFRRLGVKRMARLLIQDAAMHRRGEGLARTDTFVKEHWRGRKGV